MFLWEKRLRPDVTYRSACEPRWTPRTSYSPVTDRTGSYTRSGRLGVWSGTISGSPRQHRVRDQTPKPSNTDGDRQQTGGRPVRIAGLRRPEPACRGRRPRTPPTAASDRSPSQDV